MKLPFRFKVPNLKKLDWKLLVRDYALIVIGALIGSFGLAYFLVPFKIAPGGIGGLATALHHLWGMPVGIMMLIFNVPLFLVGLKFLGGGFGIRTLVGMVLYSVFTDFFDLVLSLGPMTTDKLMAAIYGAILLGVGLGLVFKGGGSTGGTDIPARILSRYTGLSTGISFLVFDVVIVFFAGVAFNDMDLVLYGFGALWVSIKVIDLILEGFGYARAAFIVTKKPDVVFYQIMAGLNRSATYLNGEGAYGGEKTKVIYCVVGRREVYRLKSLVKRADKEAFMVINDVHEVMGYGFRRRGSA